MFNLNILHDYRSNMASYGGGGDDMNIDGENRSMSGENRNMSNAGGDGNSNRGNGGSGNGGNRGYGDHDYRRNGSNGNGNRGSGGGNQSGDGDDDKNGRGSFFKYVVIAMLIALMIMLAITTFTDFGNSQKSEKIKYSQFIEMLDAGLVKSVVIKSSTVVITPKSSEEIKKMLSADASANASSNAAAGVTSGNVLNGSKSSGRDASADGEKNSVNEYDNDMLSAILNEDESNSSYSNFLNGAVSTTTLDENVTYYAVLPPDYNLVSRLNAAGVTYEKVTESNWSEILWYVVPFLLLWIFLAMSMRSLTKKGGILGGIGNSNAKLYVEKKTGVTFADVAGQDEAKESLTEMVDFLHNPDKYTKIGAKLPKGALLVGPPGTGKTLLAKAVAGEAGVPFFSLSGSSFVEMYVGVGASRVRDLFKKAEEMAPCIIFIDEIDAIGKSRATGREEGSNDEREQTLNQLLAEMDGFDSSKGLVILAATNRPEVLDKALLRPGRFDRRIIVEKPDMKGRIETLRVHSKNVKMDDSVDFNEIALATSGAVGSDLANMVNEAALNAVKNGRNAVSQKDMLEAVELVIAGKEKKDRILGEREKSIVAHHEVGHALIMALQKDSEPVQKITIVPRTMGSLGYVMQFPEEEKFMETQAEMEAELVSLLGGRAAEKLKFDTVTTGASNDIEKATALARSMITMYGMSDKFGLVNLESVEHRYLDGRPVKNCSEEVSAKVDKEVIKMLDKAYKKAFKMLKENEKTLDAIAQYLITEETITGKQFMEIFHRCQEENEK